MSGITAVSLFAGVGGFDLALERAGVKVTAAVEIDAAARGVIADRLPTTPLFTDATKVTADDLFRAGFVPERGILAAGWPCQGNSVAGARGGMDDPRSGLWRHVVRLLAETRARWFLGENVPGLLSVNDGDDIAVVRGDLTQLGYLGADRILDAQHFGVPQRRRRVFFVGCLGDGRRPVEVLLEPEGRSGNPPQSRQAGQGIAATLTRGTSRSGVSAPGRRQEDDVNLRGTPVVAFHLTQDPIHGEIVPAMGAKSTGQGVQTSTAVRRLTPLECERLQGFPDNWTATSNGKPQADSARYRQMGNAVAVPCVEWIARRIVSAA